MFAARPSTVVYRYVNPPGATALTSSGGASPQSVAIQAHGVNGVDPTKSVIRFTATIAGNFVPASGLAPWHIPQNAAPSAIWVRATVTAGTGWSTGSIAWQSLSGSVVEWVWTRATAGSTTATVTLDFATDSGGSNIVVTQTGIALTLETS